jgi:hypothetical protein
MAGLPHPLAFSFGPIRGSPKKAKLREWSIKLEASKVPDPPGWIEDPVYPAFHNREITKEHDVFLDFVRSSNERYTFDSTSDHEDE